MVNEQPENQPRKIIIDEDWKTQVERERDQLKHGETGDEPEPEAAAPMDQIPPASFPLLVSTMATQAMASLGQIPDPVENKPVVRMELARHYIDTLAVLEEKTRGNLDEEEKDMLEQVLHQMRMLFLAVEKQIQGS